jgi:superoxide reductase
MIKDSGVNVVCCGEKMHELIPGTVDASLEKHVPVYKVEGRNVVVNVGSVIHPMIEEHYIEWISLVTNKAVQRKLLKPNEEPSASFVILEDEKVEEVYAYCNLHGLWKA